MDGALWPAHFDAKMPSLFCGVLLTCDGNRIVRIHGSHCSHCINLDLYCVLRCVPHAPDDAIQEAVNPFVKFDGLRGGKMKNQLIAVVGALLITILFSVFGM